MSRREEFLDTAKKYISGPRADAYGSPQDNFGVTAEMWSAYKGIPFSATDVALMMILLKAARLGHNADSFDSWTDIAGYAALGGEISVGDDSWTAVTHE